MHTCAIVGSGAVKCWGANDNGQLGDNSIVQRLTPVDVVGLGGGVAAVATGATHSCALTTAGGVKCWGDNSQRSARRRLDRRSGSTPVDVSGLASGVKAIAAGDNHTCALTNAGGVKCWGQNTHGPAR